MKIAKQIKKSLMRRMIKENTHVNLTSASYPNSVFDGGNLGMLDSVKFMNGNIVNSCAKQLIKNCTCPSNFVCLNSLFVSMF